MILHAISGWTQCDIVIICIVPLDARYTVTLLWYLNIAKLRLHRWFATLLWIHHLRIITRPCYLNIAKYFHPSQSDWRTTIWLQSGDAQHKITILSMIDSTDWLPLLDTASKNYNPTLISQNTKPYFHPSQLDWRTTSTQPMMLPMMLNIN